jgi:hypothetical protein
MLYVIWTYATTYGEYNIFWRPNYLCNETRLCNPFCVMYNLENKYFSLYMSMTIYNLHGHKAKGTI